MAYTIGVMSTNLGGAYISNLLEHIQQVLQPQGNRLIVIRSDEQSQMPKFAWNQVDGWIFLPFMPGVEEVAAAGKPLATISRAMPGICPSVMADNYGGVKEAVRHLIAHGHRQIGFCGWIEQEEIQQRYQGYQDALAEAGIPFDPALVFEAAFNMDADGYAVGQRMIERGLPCTALVAATDMNALGVLEALQDAGYSVPQNLALIGFDNIPQAQSADPPLTTVQQRMDLLVGKAIELVLAQCAGQTIAPDVYQVETQLVVRASCGCQLVALPDAGASADTPRERLARQLVAQLVAPNQLPADTPVSDIWPGVTTVLDTYNAALTGEAAPPPALLSRAWKQATKLCSSVDALLGLVQLLRDDRQNDDTRDAAANARLGAFFEQSRLDLMRALLRNELAHIRQLGRFVHANYDMSVALLSGAPQMAQSLDWLAPTPALWACLGLWDDPATCAELVVAGSYQRETGEAMPPPPGQRCSPRDFPLAEWLPPMPDGGQHTVTLLPVRTPTRQWGVLAIIGQTGIEVIGDLSNIATWGSLLSIALERDALVTSLTQQQATLQEAYQRERALASTVRDLGCPIIPLLPGMLLVPLIGVIDTGRAQMMIETVLEGVSQHQADLVLFDITGVPLVDTQVAQALLQTTKATQLLGAQVALVGVRAEVAQSLVALGADLGSLTVYGTLSVALERLALRGTLGAKP